MANEFDPDSKEVREGPYQPSEDFDEADEPRRSGGFLITGIVTLAVVGGGLWYAFDRSGGKSGEVPVIQSDSRPSRVKPDQPGGMEVPNQDKLIYERMGAQPGPGDERLMPAPEQPREHPVAPPDTAGTKPAPVAEASVPPATKPAPPAEAAKPVKPAEPPRPMKATELPKPVPVEPPKVAALVPPASPAAAAPAVKGGGAYVAQLDPAATPAVALPVVKGSGAYLVQLGALKSQESATQEWHRMQAAHKELAGFAPDVMKVDLGPKGTFYRLRAGPLGSREAAEGLCAQLSGQGQNCLVAKR